MALSTSYQTTSTLPVSINDIRDKFYDGEKLEPSEFMALKNYDKYRIAYLNSATTGEEFDKRYLELQAKANLSSFLDFIDFDKIA